MSIATSPSKITITAVAALISWSVFCLGGIGNVAAQSLSDDENGRYTLSPVPDGVIRLDTRTGAVSTCSNAGAGWACYAVPDERAALDAEIGRLQAENEASRKELEKLKAELAARGPTVTGKIDEPLPKTDSLKKPEPKVAEGERKIEIPLPSDRDMDRVMSFLEQAWRRLVEMANRMQKDFSGKI
ncbi:MAG: hypothetical protein E8A46_17835 [Bradyrhizobium sp.]|jgi:hypothetical protein|uniref:hypothetical protein n=1 Tax=Bradyrhizobium sp. TaxID=376 RepID=UPI00121724B1|nr:hypothetical protein [Bradyrhizobium sp.]THD50506.1 MAG: hypothetical protein E8A46_17835 [Bradyrhizobium sp.]